MADAVKIESFAYLEDEMFYYGEEINIDDSVSEESEERLVKLLEEVLGFSLKR